MLKNSETKTKGKATRKATKTVRSENELREAIDGKLAILASYSGKATDKQSAYMIDLAIRINGLITDLRDLEGNK